jgi:pimeloyl-ACP methyl ester carboxylesterase
MRTHYLEAGDGEPVVLVHGGGPGAGAAHGWPNTIPALAEHFRVIAIDVLGFGETEKPAGLAYSHQDQVDHLAAFVDTLCLAPVKLAGNSAGAYIVAKCAVDYFERVDRVFLISSTTLAHGMGIPPILDAPGRVALREYDGSEEKMREFMVAIRTTPPSDELVRSRVAMANLPGATEAWQAILAYNRALAEDPNLLQRYMFRDRLPKLTVPMTMIWGEIDTFGPPQLVDELRELLPNIPIDIIEGAGHQVQNEAPDEVNRRMIEFFTTDARATG